MCGWFRARFICVHRGTSLHSHKTRGVRKTKSVHQHQLHTFFVVVRRGREEGRKEERKEGREGNSAIFWSYFMPAIGGDQKHGPSYVVTVIFEKEDIVSERILVNTSRVLRETFPSPRLGEFRHKLLMKKEGTLHMGLRVAHGTKVCI